MLRAKQLARSAKRRMNKNTSRPTALILGHEKKRTEDSEEMRTEID